jgi:hypothetical protein
MGWKYVAVASSSPPPAPVDPASATPPPGNYDLTIGCHPMLGRGVPNTRACQKRLSGELPSDSLPRNILRNIGATQAHTAAQVIFQRGGVCQGSM